MYRMLSDGVVGFDGANGRFLRHLLFKKEADLSNRTLHVSWKSDAAFQSAKPEVSKCQIGSLDGTLEEVAVNLINQRNE